MADIRETYSIDVKGEQGLVRLAGHVENVGKKSRESKNLTDQFIRAAGGHQVASGNVFERMATSLDKMAAELKKSETAFSFFSKSLLQGALGMVGEHFTGRILQGLKPLPDGIGRIGKAALDKVKALVASIGGAFRGFGGGGGGGGGLPDLGKGLSAAPAAGFAAGLAGVAVAAAAATVAVVATVAIVKSLASAIASAVQHVAKLGSELTDLSARTGMSVEALQEVRFAGALVGVELTEVTQAVNLMQKRLVETPAAFTALGLSVTHLKQLAPEEQLAAVADAIQRIADPAEQSRAAMELFGRAGASLLPLLKGGFGDAANEAERLGIVLDRETVASLDALDDATVKLDATWSALTTQLAATIARNPALIEGVDGLAVAIGHVAQAIKDNKATFDYWVELMSRFTGLGQIGDAVRAAGLVGDVVTGNVQTPEVRTPLASNVGGAIDFDAIGARALAATKTDLKEDEKAGERLKQAIKQLRDMTIDAQKSLAELRAKASGGLEEVIAKAQADTAAAMAKLPKGVDTSAIVEILKQIEAQKILNARMAEAAELAKKLKTEQQEISKLLGERALNRAGGSPEQAFQQMQRQVSANTGGSGKLLSEETTTVTKFWSRDPEIEAELKRTGGKLFGEPVKSGFAKTMEELPDVILGAIQGGGNVGEAIGAFLGGKAGEALGKAIGGPIGGAIGKTLGTLGGKLLGGLFGGGEHAKVNDLRDSMFETAGGFDEMNKRAHAAGLTLKAVLDAKTVKDYEAAVAMLNTRLEFIESFGGIEELRRQAEEAQVPLDALFDATDAHELKRAIEGITDEIAAWTDANKALDDAMGRWGITVDQLSGKARQLRLDADFKQLYTDWRVLAEGGGVDPTVLWEKMGESINKYVNSAIGAGATIPEAMRPILQWAVDNKLLLDENGNAFESLEASGVTFAQTLEQSIGKLIDKIDLFVSKLLGVPPNVNTNVTTTFTGGDVPGSPYPIPAASGFGPMVAPNMGRGLGPLVQTHAGEGILVVPKHKMKGKVPFFFHAAGGFGDEGPNIEERIANRQAAREASSSTTSDVIGSGNASTTQQAAATAAAVEETRASVRELKEIVKQLAERPTADVTLAPTINAQMDPTQTIQGQQNMVRIVRKGIVDDLYNLVPDLVDAVKFAAGK